jgi:hypothetical protein
VYCSPEAIPNTFRSTLKRLSNFPVHSFIFPSTFWAFPTFSGSLFHLSLYFLGPSPHFRSTLSSFPLLSWPLPIFSGPLFYLSLYFLGPSPHFPVHSFIFPSILLASPHIFRSTLTSLTCTYLKYSCVTSCVCQ